MTANATTTTKIKKPRRSVVPVLCIAFPSSSKNAFTPQCPLCRHQLAICAAVLRKPPRCGLGCVRRRQARVGDWMKGNLAAIKGSDVPMPLPLRTEAEPCAVRLRTGVGCSREPVRGRVARPSIPAAVPGVAHVTAISGCGEGVGAAVTSSSSAVPARGGAQRAFRRTCRWSSGAVGTRGRRRVRAGPTR